MKRVLLLLLWIVSFMGVAATESHAQECKAPTGLFASARDSVASLNWRALSDNTKYLVQWKLRRDSVWKTEEAGTNTLLIKGLKPCTEYQFRVQVMCGSALASPYSEPISFKTIGCNAPCTTPRDVKGVTTDALATFSWSATGARGYQVQFKLAEAAETEWRSVSVNTTNYTVSGLRVCTKYQFRVRSLCNSTGSTVIYSEWSPIITVATRGCTADRCEAPKLLSFQVQSSGALLKWDAPATGKYEIQWMAISSNGVWQNITGVSGNTYNLANLRPCTEYLFRVRTACANNVFSAWSYTVRFKTGGCEPVCPAPREVVIHTADTVAVVNWAGTGASGYIVQYRSLPDTSWKSVRATATVQVLTGLKRCAKYEVRVQSVCNNILSTAFTYAKFETGFCRVDCAMPQGLRGQIVDGTTAYFSWQHTGARAYIMEYKINMDNSEWKRDSATTNAYKIGNLERCKMYAFRVRAICDGRLTEPSPIFFLNTGGCEPACTAPRGLEARLYNDTAAVLVWDALLNERAVYEIQYRNARDTAASAWVAAKSEVREFKLAALKRCLVYEIRVRRLCTNAMSEWAYVKLETKGCPNNTTCLIPIDLKVDTVSGGVAMYWSGTQNTKYEIQYRLAGTIDYKSEYVYTPAHKLALPCGVYEWRVRRGCENGISDWANGPRFEIRGCANTCLKPESLKFQLSNDTTAVIYWTGLATMKYEVQYRPTVGDTGTETPWKSISLTGIETRLLLYKCGIFEWRVRKICENGTSDWTFGDKIITRGCPVTGCVVPVGLKAEFRADTTFVKWETTSIVPNTFFEIQYRKADDSAWVTSRTDQRLKIILGLVKCTKYIIRVRTMCSNTTFSDWVELSYAYGCLIDTDGVSALSRNAVKEFGIYPNPGGDYVQVTYKLENAADIQVDMVNLQGKVVNTIKSGVQEAGNYMQVFDNMAQVQSGIYFIAVRANGKVVSTQKWMKQ
jgi:hypothetical protein